MNAHTHPSIDRTALAALLRAEHGDPFAILGPHPVRGGWEIRALLPEARKLDLVLLGDGGEHSLPMERIDEAGFFCVRVEGKDRPSYRLRLDVEGRIFLREDPYRFGPVHDAGDLTALREPGTDRVFKVLGAHPRTVEGVAGYLFALWAPNARSTAVVGDFNGWDGRRNPMRLRHEAGVWELFLPGLKAGMRYKFELHGPHGNLLPQKADPLAFAAEHPPANASVLAALPDFPRLHTAPKVEDARHAPVSIYECHLGSWARVPEDGNRVLTYRELGERLVPYVKDLGFTHIELLPVHEFPFDGSWGYQPVSLFAPTSRFGGPADFAAFVEAVHTAGLGLIIDWVPGHFPLDAHGLAQFDGTHLYEHADPRQGFHQDWGTAIYNYDREEVSAFLVANARFWLERYGVDGLRVDAVASMLYLDYSRKAGEWVPNRHGGNENLGAVAFLKTMNETAYQAAPRTLTIAEESTAWPGVSKPTYAGGLGFGFKWNMGWMHDTLRYMQQEPIHRRHHHHDMTFGMVYAYSENYVLPLSHDEVVHGKGSLFSRMPGDRWQRFANLRAYLAFMWGHPGKKLLFMGGEFGQEREWNYAASLDWHLLDDPLHAGMRDLVRDLNRLYRDEPALHRHDCEPQGFDWLIGDDADQSVFVFARNGDGPDEMAIVACNFTPVPRHGYRVGVPEDGFYAELLNSDASAYGGSGVGNSGGIAAEPVASHGHPQSLSLTLPPLATIVLKRRAA